MSPVSFSLAAVSCLVSDPPLGVGPETDSPHGVLSQTKDKTESRQTVNLCMHDKTCAQTLSADEHALACTVSERLFARPSGLSPYVSRCKSLILSAIRVTSAYGLLGVYSRHASE